MELHCKLESSEPIQSYSDSSSLSFSSQPHNAENVCRDTVTVQMQIKQKLTVTPTGNLTDNQPQLRHQLKRKIHNNFQSEDCLLTTQLQIGNFHCVLIFVEGMLDEILTREKLDACENFPQIPLNAKKWTCWILDRRNFHIYCKIKNLYSCKVWIKIGQKEENEVGKWKKWQWM